MKRPTLDLKLRQARLARFRFEERLSSHGRKRVKQGNKYVPPGQLIKAPKCFDLTKGSGNEVIKFLRAVATSVLKYKLKVRLNFKDTASFYPAGTILFYAELDRIISMSNMDKPITIIEPRARRPREVLKQIGIFELTNDKCNVIPSREDVVYWKATKGYDQSGENLAMLEVVAERVNKAHTAQLELSGVWRGVSEAVANSVEHAYVKPRDDGFAGLPNTRWWMFTQLRRGIFTMAVCDLGCGYRATIDQTIPETFIREISAILGQGNRDVFAINTAMEYGRSSTRQSERGKGSRDALSVIKKHGQGELMIVSNTGMVHYKFNGGEQVRQFDASLGIDIRGTIVWWKLPLKETSTWP